MRSAGCSPLSSPLCLPPPGLARARGVAVREGGSTGGRGGEINTTRATRERTERQIDLIISRKEKIQIKTTPSAPSRTRLHPADRCASLPRADRCFRRTEDLRFVIFTSTHYCLVFRKPHDIRRHDTSWLRRAEVGKYVNQNTPVVCYGVWRLNGIHTLTLSPHLSWQIYANVCLKHIQCYTLGISALTVFTEHWRSLFGVY